MDNTLNYQHKLVNELNDSITSLLEQSDEEKKKDIESIRQDINDLRNLINPDNNIHTCKCLCIAPITTSPLDINISLTYIPSANVCLYLNLS